ncbi:MAG: hypothetical protein COU11_00665 [Candidatus Harrisonbacteria bacterium CG10_big_fil_rev_8_21_14_0_10_49_15]|uniref:GIY-YIG domain-containing protein n=1 Tax=Candidatus Harrisonbacteria bacterium CG10_big_fil_rev_8_21_14_0_10_49_15 TaxID=1974587 RepID=A0A2H0ULU0_9BACT|nr:MAG: hypothetical protein COU11_00665 [Candidatus Harrisonbacteria bacterium CG10_big_fil_rev_8_21_14_0_10_49_15]
MITVYVLVNKYQKIYIGQTNDVVRRLNEHNRNHTISTSGKGLWKIAHSEEYEDRSTAMRREKALKSSRGRAWIRSIILKGSASVG